jgi:hypothetical protein
MADFLIQLPRLHLYVKCGGYKMDECFMFVYMDELDHYGLTRKVMYLSKL